MPCIFSQLRHWEVNFYPYYNSECGKDEQKHFAMKNPIAIQTSKTELLV